MSIVLKPDSKVWAIVDGVREACGSEQEDGTIRKAQSQQVVEGILSALLEAADASTLNKVLDSATAQNRKDDRRPQYIAAVANARQAAAFASLPDNAAEIDKLMQQLAARKAQLDNKHK